MTGAGKMAPAPFMCLADVDDVDVSAPYQVVGLLCGELIDHASIITDE